MSSLEIIITPPDLIARFHRFPDTVEREMERTSKQALAHMQGSVPSYPPPPPNSRYVRTGTLGRSIGLGGRADIYGVERIGGGWEATIGTRLSYAPYVIGEGDQAPVHAGRWWTTRTVLERATPGITRLFEAMAKRLVTELGG